MLGFADVMFVAVFTWDRVYTCVRGGFIVGLFCDVYEVFIVLYVDKINSLFEDTNTYKISNLIIINKNIITFNNFQKTPNEPKTRDIPHRTPPYNPNIL